MASSARADRDDAANAKRLAKVTLDGNRRLLACLPIEMGEGDDGGRGTNRAEAICSLPPAIAAGEPRWLLLYDAPGADRRDGEHTVFGDLLQHE